MRMTNRRIYNGSRLRVARAIGIAGARWEHAHMMAFLNDNERNGRVVRSVRKQSHARILDGVHFVIEHGLLKGSSVYVH